MVEIQEIHKELKALCKKLESMEKNKAESNSNVSLINLNRILNNTRNYGIVAHKLENLDEHEQEIYMTMLFVIAGFEKESYESTLVFICRIINGIGFKGDVKELFSSAKKINQNYIDEFTRIFEKTDIKLLFILDALLVVGNFNKTSKEVLAFISQICIVMKIEKDQILMLSNMARAILTNNINEYNCDVLNTYGDLFDCYIGNIVCTSNYELINEKYKKFFSKYDELINANEKYKNFFVNSILPESIDSILIHIYIKEEGNKILSNCIYNHNRNREQVTYKNIKYSYYYFLSEINCNYGSQFTSNDEYKYVTKLIGFSVESPLAYSYVMNIFQTKLKELESEENKIE